jgi:hypothetical protein
MTTVLRSVALIAVAMLVILIVLPATLVAAGS